ncbi:TDT family transporter [Deinococcus maricopensis]|uniref:C4-dicarboxylate transporter/malic acid transport protein n=1 Tax=Deinococcus maricopensis (strain DSM 21211 / LMG 22137 / NRRL B-23946 / LB-34) TaxID=709986 RepID=E8U313_DEIML|nr:TDT family transporter [Deinococcus maricopensis]ADV65751.1 C4-dicarboxylate transporter/malic acid transport protein [Deinococcus maricopensis DSM 21211]
MQRSLPAETRAERVLRPFTPNHFTITMGTGIVALMLARVPLPSPGLTWVGEALWWLDVTLFLAFSLLFALRVVLLPHATRDLLRDPVHALFLGAIPMSLATLLNGLLTFGLPRLGPEVIPFALSAWHVDAALSVACGLLVPYLMITRQQHHFSTLSATWLLPLVPCEVAAASGGLLAPHLAPDLARGVIEGSYVLWALSVPLVLGVLALWFLRLVQEGLPARELGASVWLPLGPLGTGALGLMLLGTASTSAFVGTPLAGVGSVAFGVGVLGGALLWGYGLWWGLLAALKTARLVRQGLPFNLGWWGFTFPLGVFTAATFTLAQQTHVQALLVVACALVVALAGTWLVVAARTWTAWRSGALYPR